MQTADSIRAAKNLEVGAVILQVHKAQTDPSRALVN